MDFNFKELNKEIEEKLNNVFPAKNSFIEVMPENVLMPKKFIELAEPIRSLKTFADDVWMVSYPRTGSTWAQEMIWLLGNKLDFEGAKEMLSKRSPMVELSALFSLDHSDWVTSSFGNTVEIVKNLPQPRFARSHLPYHLLPKDMASSKAKIVYTARNPKDLCVSFYHYLKFMHGMNGSFNEFFELFINGQTPIGSYWKHVLPFWKLSTEPNILFLKYEDMKRDLPAVVKKCAKFLNVDYQITEEDMLKICKHLKFDTMQKNTAVNLELILPPAIADSTSDTNGNSNGDDMTEKVSEPTKFIRKGEVGDWKNYLNAEMSERVDAWTDKNTKGSGLIFDYE